MTPNKLEAAATAIKVHLVSRLLTEGYVSAREGRRLYDSDIDDILAEVFKHCPRVLIPISGGFLSIESQDNAT